MQVFYSSPWIPAEWIEAHGLEPRGVWGAEDFGQGALAFSAGVCAFAGAMARFVQTHRDSAAVFATTCDQMRRSFDAFAAAERSRAFLFNIPATWQSRVGLRIFRAEVERLGRFLEAHGGRRPTAEALARIVEQRGRLRQRLIEAGTHCSARQFAEAIARFHWEGSVDLSAPPAPPPSNSIPLAMVGGPLVPSQWNLLDTLETAGARVVLNATENGERSLSPAFPDECFHDDPAGALAGAYFENCVDVFQRPNTRLYSWLGERLAARGVRGIVLWVYTACDLWRAEAQTLRETFDLPLLMLEADEAQPGSPRQMGRIQAFIETLR